MGISVRALSLALHVLALQSANEFRITEKQNASLIQREIEPLAMIT